MDENSWKFCDFVLMMFCCFCSLVLLGFPLRALGVSHVFLPLALSV